ncbi:MAG: GNAT family N-acetyltransferase [Bacillota bacterium]|nr:GNAT family N-acetyltransferase [Bacillota bacterium]
MKLFIKKFQELSNEELYGIIKLRVDIFVVEQNCPYADLDDLDQEAIHVFLKDGEKILAYVRLMDRGVESDHVAIGRVVVSHKGLGLGRRIMEEGIKAAKEIFAADIIYLEAQKYAQGFYEKLGFVQVSDEFILDDIPHIKMELNEKI